MGRMHFRISKILVMVFVLFGVVFIQVGYSALESSFYISGEANIKQPLRKLLYAPFDSIGWSHPPKMLLYLPMDGVGYLDKSIENEFDKKPFTDSITGKDFTLLGGSVTRFSQEVKVGNRSGYFSGISNQRINIQTSELNFGTKDFTISFWLNPQENASKSFPTIFGNDDTRYSTVRFIFRQSDNMILVCKGAAIFQSIIQVEHKTNFYNTWVHYALIRKNGIFSLYEDGVKIGENSNLKDYIIDLSNFSIGGDDDGVATNSNRTAYTGYIDDFAVYNYVKWETDFSPPTTAQTDANCLYLDFDIPNFEINREPLKDNISGNYFSILGNAILEGKDDNSKFGGSSLYFPGTMHQRINTINPGLNFGVNDFTVSFWLNPQENPSRVFPTIFGNDDTRYSTIRFIFKQSDNTIVICKGSAIYETIIQVKHKTNIYNTWTHYALVRKNGVFSLYEDGVKIGENSDFKDYIVDLSNLSIGGDDDGVGTNSNRTAYKGYMDDFAIYNYAKYDSNFEVPMSNAMSDSMNQQEDLLVIKDVVSNTDFSILGDSRLIGTDGTKKFGDASLYFPGTINQRINIKSSELNFGTKDFTISFWLNPDENQVRQYPMIFTNDDNTRSTLRFYLLISLGTIRLDSYDTLRTPAITLIIDSNKKWNANEWSHYALVRKDGIFYLYENGIKIGENASLKSFPIDLSNLSIGGNDDEGNQESGNRTAYKGYIDDFVIYNKAIYNGDFTPPSSPASNQ